MSDNPEYPHSPNCVDTEMFGEFLRRAPVVEPGRTAKDSCLPIGESTDYFRGGRLKGGQ